MAHLKKYLRLCLNFLCSFTFFILIVQEKGACHLIKKIKKRNFKYIHSDFQYMYWYLFYISLDIYDIMLFF